VSVLLAILLGINSHLARLRRDQAALRAVQAAESAAADYKGAVARLPGLRDEAQRASGVFAEDDTHAKRRGEWPK
jgi:hypothetical protein